MCCSSNRGRGGEMADRQTVTAAWARGGAVCRPRAHRLGREVLKAATKPTLAPSLHSIPSSSLCPRQSGRPSRCRCRELRRHRTRSPLHPHPPDHVHGAATNPSTSSTPLSSKSSQGKGLLADSAAVAMGSTSPELGCSMAGVARALLDLPFLPH
jgi:hypothetical protein